MGSEIYVFEGEMANVKWTLYSCRKQNGENQKILRKAEKKLGWNIFTHKAINVWNKILRSSFKGKALMDSKAV